MLIPSTITARRTRGYTSTWYIHPTTRKHDFEPMDGRGRSIFQPPQCQAVNPSRWSTLPPLYLRLLHPCERGLERLNTIVENALPTQEIEAEDMSTCSKMPSRTLTRRENPPTWRNYYLRPC